MESVESERIPSFASRHFELSAPAMAVLDGGLKSPSSAREALHDIYLAQAVNDGEASCRRSALVAAARRRWTSPA